MRKEYESPIMEVIDFDIKDDVLGGSGCPTYCYVDCYDVSECYIAECTFECPIYSSSSL